MWEQLQKGFRGGVGAVPANTLLFQIVVERHHMRRFDLGHLEMPESGTDPATHPSIIVERLGLQLLVGVFLKPAVDQVIQQHV